MNKPVVVFIRGLNTWGKDDLCYGPINFGRYDRYLKPLFELEKIDFRSIDQLGNGSIEELTAKTEKWLDTQDFLENQKLHILAHSTGGLIARKLVQDRSYNLKIKSITTLCTPHRGTPVAEQALEISNSISITKAFLSFVGYNLESRKKFFEMLSPNELKKFNQIYPIPKDVFCQSLVARTDTRNRSFVFRIMDKKLKNLESDGLVPELSQIWGKVLMFAELDHASSLGHCIFLSSKKKEKHKIEFKNLIKKYINFLKTFEYKVK